MKKWIVGLVLALGVIGITWAWAALPAGNAQVEVMPQSTGEYAGTFASEAYFSSFSNRCDISCRNGSFFSVNGFSTNNCCEQCAELCSDTCVASGDGPSVLCGGI